MKKFILSFFLFIMGTGIFTLSFAETKTVWDTNWNVMTLWQADTSISGEYIYDDGVLTGTITGDTFKGYWREYNNAQSCGPNNAWSGPVVFKFSKDGKSFTGSWGYCSTGIDDLDPEGTGWTGTLKEGVTGYTQSECETAGRYWCDGECQINTCDETLTQVDCEKAGRFWCDDTCQVTECDSSTTPECKISIDGITVSGTKEIGSSITFTMNAKNSCSSTIYYRYSVHPDYGTDGYTGLKWSSMTSTEYTTENSINYTFDKSGQYIVVVWAKNATTDSNTNVEIIGVSVNIDEQGQEPYFPF